MKGEVSFSVIIPAYNSRDTLTRALESVLAQIFPAHEILVVDDGSTDDSAALAEPLLAGTGKVIRLSQNSGPAAARNAGIAMATGTHIAFLDADDYWLPPKLACIKSALEIYPEAALLFHARNLPPGIPLPTEARIFPLWRLLVHNPVATPCAVVRRSSLRFSEDLRWMEDYDFFLRHAEKGPVFYLPQVLTILGRPILASGGQSSRRWKMRISEMRVLWRFATRHPAFYLLLPLCISWILAKHFLHEGKRFLRC